MDGEQQKQPVRLFSDRPLHELANYYLNLGPADIPDSGFVVSGIGGRFPNADNLNELWDNLRNGKDMVLGPDDKRWPLGKYSLKLSASALIAPARNPSYVMINSELARDLL